MSVGVQEFIDYRSTRFEEQFQGVDVVIDLVGDTDQTNLRSIGVVKPGGIFVGIPAGVSPQVAAAAQARGIRTTPFLVEPDHTALSSIAELVDSGKLRVAVEKTFPLEQAGAAHDAAAAGHRLGKIVIEVAQ